MRVLRPVFPHAMAPRGGGGGGGGLGPKPADLTRPAARNDGRFPSARVMGEIRGHTGGTSDHAVMSEFAALLDPDLVGYDGGDGIATPTPQRLMQISEYLEALQG